MVRRSKTSHRTPQTQAGEDQEENVPHGADSKENLLRANQKDYFIMPHMNGNEADPSSRSVSLPPSVTYSEKCSAAVYPANAQLQLFLTVGFGIAHEKRSLAVHGDVSRDSRVFWNPKIITMKIRYISNSQSCGASSTWTIISH